MVALSSGEAEYYALLRLAAELLFFGYLLEEMRRGVRLLARTDSSAAKGMAGRSGAGSVKHNETKYFWLQEKVRSKALALEKWKGTENPADLGTKVLSGESIKRLLPQVSRAETSRGVE